MDLEAALRGTDLRRRRLAGVFYRRGVAGSLSEVGDDRQLDFIDAFAAIFAELASDADGPRFRPKAVRGYCTLVDYHLSRRELRLDARTGPAAGRAQLGVAGQLPATRCGKRWPPWPRRDGSGWLRCCPRRQTQVCYAATGFGLAVVARRP